MADEALSAKELEAAYLDMQAARAALDAANYRVDNGLVFVGSIQGLENMVRFTEELYRIAAQAHAGTLVGDGD